MNAYSAPTEFLDPRAGTSVPFGEAIIAESGADAAEMPAGAVALASLALLAATVAALLI